MLSSLQWPYGILISCKTLSYLASASHSPWMSCVGSLVTVSSVVKSSSHGCLPDLRRLRRPSADLPNVSPSRLSFLSIAAHGLFCLPYSLFCELARKSIFLVTVWFECIWVALFCFMELGMSCSCHAFRATSDIGLVLVSKAGAAAASAAGADQLCATPLYWSTSRLFHDSCF